MSTATATPGRVAVGDSPPGTTTTVATRVRAHAHSRGGAVAMREKELGVWREVTWSSYWDTVLTVGHALLALGVAPGDRVAVHSENRREWLYTDVATIAVRGATVGLYPTNPPAEVGYLLSHSGARILVAEDQEQVDKALEVIDRCPGLERVVYVEPRGIRHRYTHPKLLSWDDLLDLGTKHRSTHPGAVERLMADAMPDDIVTLVYTSGTTGPPKGVMLSTSNVEFAMGVLMGRKGVMSPPPTPHDLLLSYLPLCHVAERFFTTWLNAASGAQVNFAESIATVQPNLREIQPTILFGVPRIWERVLATVSIGIRNSTWLKRTNGRLWLAAAQRIGNTLVRTGGRHTIRSRLLYAVGWVFLYRALRERIGMRRVRYAASGAAPIAPEVLRFFMGIGVPMHEIYGMTENTGMATTNRPGRVKLGTVGEPLGGVQLRLDETTGEILIRHPGVFVGYFNDAEATARTKEPNGWLHTGDIGEMVDGTYVKITDRAKDILITAGGKNISPSEIENALKASPYIKEAIVVGDRRPYLVALVGVELDTVGDWATRQGIAYTTYRDLGEQPQVAKLVQGVVDETNKLFASVEQIKKFRMLPRELDHEAGELTATQKVKRSTIIKLFDDLVEDMYGKASGGGAR